MRDSHAMATVGQEAADALLAILDDGMSILEEEREIFLGGGYDRLQDLLARKRAVIDRLEAAVRSAPRSAMAASALRRLIAMSRRNEQIIEAARQGLAYARRRIASIAETRKGAVAYAEDGTRIACSADLLRTERSA